MIREPLRKQLLGFGDCLKMWDGDEGESDVTPRFLTCLAGNAEAGTTGDKNELG